MTRLRSGLALVLVALGLALLPTPVGAAAPVEVCSGGSHTATALCLTYGFTVYDAGTATETTKTQAPVDVALSFQNTSTNYVTQPNRPRWLNAISASFPGTLLLTPTADLPDELLVAGDSTDCTAGADVSFSTCTAGHGVAYVYNVFGILCTGAPCRATFGIQRIVNERDNVGTNYGQYRAELSLCLDTNGGTPSCDQQQSQSATVTINRGSVGAPFVLDMSVPTISGVQDVTIDSADLKLNGTASKLANGTSVSPKTVLRLPQKCGVSQVSGTVTSNNNTTVSATIPFETTGCADLSLAASKSVITFRGSSILSGTLTDYDAKAGMPDQTIQLKQCPFVGKPCSTRSTTTDGTGHYAFTVKPARTTAYSVTHPFDGTHPAVTKTTTVKVRPIVTLRVSATKFKSGGSVKLTGSVQPLHAKKTVVIQRKIAGVWKKIGTATLTAKSFYAKTVVLKGAKGSKALLRVVMPAHADHLASTSKPVTITFL